MGHRSGLTAAWAAVVVLFIAACGGSGGGGGDAAAPSAPAAPAGLSATPGNTQALLTWPAVTGATSYNVYSSPTSPATTGGTKTTVSTPGATLPALTNGTPVYAVVTAVNAIGESALSNQVCAVPTTASTAGVTLYDPLCGGTLDGTKWATPLFDYGVASSAMVLGSQISSMESRTVQGLTYQTLASVIPPAGQRVSTLTADITVPVSTATRTGSADIRALVRLLYQPPATRLNFPGGVQDQLVIEVGLRDSGSGLQAFRNVRHCDSSNCTTRSTTGIVITDPAGFTATGSGIEASAAAAYDTKYTVSATLNESTGVLGWSIVGGAFGPGVTGTADPTTYVGTAPWSGVALAGNGFLSGQVGNRVFDDTVPAGSSGNISARFENVRAGFNGAAASLFDNFGGTGGNSGPTELSAAKWTTSGTSPSKVSAALAAGSLAVHAQTTSPSTLGVNNLQSLSFNDPAAVNTLQADVTISACSNSLSATPGASNRAQIQGNFYNDNSAGNQLNSNIGEVRAFVILDCVPATAVARFLILRIDNQAGTATTAISSGTIALVGAATGATHTLRLSWDPTTHTVTFVVDGNQVVVNPTVAGPNVTTPVAFAKPANSPIRLLLWSVNVPLSPTATGATGSMDFKVNNVFTAP